MKLLYRMFLILMLCCLHLSAVAKTSLEEMIKDDKLKKQGEDSKRLIFEEVSSLCNFTDVASIAYPSGGSSSSWILLMRREFYKSGSFSSSRTLSARNPVGELGNPDRLKSLLKLEKECVSAQLSDVVLEFVRVNLIQEFCANGLQGEANKLWEALDRGRYPVEWIQWISLVSVARSVNRKIDRSLIDEYIRKFPDSEIGWKAKLIQNLFKEIQDGSVLEQDRRARRDIIKYMLTNFGSLRDTFGARLFTTLCDYSIGAEQQDLLAFSEILSVEKNYNPADLLEGYKKFKARVDAQPGTGKGAAPSPSKGVSPSLGTAFKFKASSDAEKRTRDFLIMPFYFSERTPDPSRRRF